MVKIIAVMAHFYYMLLLDHIDIIAALCANFVGA